MHALSPRVGACCIHGCTAATEANGATGAVNQHEVRVRSKRFVGAFRVGSTCPCWAMVGFAGLVPDHCTVPKSGCSTDGFFK